MKGVELELIPVFGFSVYKPVQSLLGNKHLGF
jgi:hypothetical protein